MSPARRIRVLLGVLGLALVLQAATIGLTDDEAYYWVLARTPDWGYAYHPPAIAWSIALFEHALGWVSSAFWFRVLVVRLPAIFAILACARLASGWLEDVGVPERSRGLLALFSFSGIFALSWMMVPDLPLLLGWMLAFVGTWRYCARDAIADRLTIAAGCGLLMLSKYSGVLAVFSSVACMLAWAPRGRKYPGIVAALLGAVVTLTPNLVWNAHHGWGAIAYQFMERHGDGKISWVRYGRFLATQLLVTGPLLFFMPGILARAVLRPERRRLALFLLAWIVPAGVFWVQPLFSDFKPHWALIAWWPAALGMAAFVAFSAVPRAWARAQVAYGLFVALGVAVACHFPIGARFTSDPLLDVSNDLYGWGELESRMKAELPPADSMLPVLASRYQTASQASFALPARAVSLVPRDLKARDEWPVVGASDGEGPEWPRLLKPVLFVGDNRYSAGPDFKDADCAALKPFDFARSGYRAKSILVWKCSPRVPLPKT